MGDLIELYDYNVVPLETSLGKVGRDSDGVVLRPALVRLVPEPAEHSPKKRYVVLNGRSGTTYTVEVLKTFWKGRKLRRMGPAKVLEFGPVA